MTSASAIIPTYRQCLPSRCLANGHIPSQYAYYLLHSGFLLGLFFETEDGSDMFLQNA
jgi:hypothetical protein